MSNGFKFLPIYTVAVGVPLALYTLLSSWWLCIGAFAICGTWGFAYGMRREAASLDIAGVPVPKPLACGGTSLLDLRTPTRGPSGTCPGRVLQAPHCC